MEDNYLRNAKIMSALSTPMRLQILDMLSCGELCASQIQDAFSITQPTTSYHMKLMVDSGIVTMRNEGKYVFYSLNQDRLQTFFQEVQQMASDSESCVCHRISMNPCKEE